MNYELRITNYECNDRITNCELVWRYLKSSMAFIAIVTLFIGCENTPTEVARYTPEPVFSAYLYNGEPVEAVYLERIATFNPAYDPQNAGIRNASIRIMGGGDTLNMVEDPGFHGRYIPEANQFLIPRGRVNYRIEAMTPSNEFLWAETVVPDTFTDLDVYLMDVPGQRYDVQDGDTLTREDPLMFWEWPATESAGGYAGTIVALTDRDSLVPLDPDWDAATDSVKMEERQRANFTVMREDQRRISIAWIFFQWEGPTRIELQAVSKSYYDYLFSSFRIRQGMADRPICNIHGGLGIFSGISRKSINVYMKRVE